MQTQPSGEVLNAQGTPIPALYAAGRTACGLATLGRSIYSPGLSLADTTYFGREAGRAAAG
ncbi:FAD-binding protein [Algiphilus sp. W345]|uniref:FAD-binding protein n=1 Tax=Banduia mediterranea TaxID=3075609 RepID=A0ABU2WHI6_9GAMM|nr:FAD-binding protein [Algiphilus sp. W345]MDT0497328.1 FAD-binding protein [Algiphilus sp. W345]